MKASFPRAAVPWLPALTSALLVVVLAGAFLPHQCLWVDETTQLKGLTLDSGELLRWLAGSDAGRFGVPGDRMPPLSYLAGKAWATIFGLDERSLRWLGVVLVAAAAAVVARTAFRFSGVTGAFIAGTIFALSPNVVSWAVEIRAYPLFLLTAACSFLAFSHIVLRPTEVTHGRAGALSIALLAAMYTHFFGILLAVGLGVAALWVVRKNGGRLRPLLVSLAAAAGLSLGLLPFIFASVAVSPGTEASGSGLRDMVRLFYRFAGHPAISLSPPAAALAVLGTAGLVFLSLRPKAPAGTSARTWALAIAAGLAVTVAGGLFARGFKAYTTSYSIWVLPGLAVLAAMAWPARERAGRLLAGGALAALVTAQGFGSYQLVTRGELFAHGPHARLRNAVRNHSSADLVVVHDNAAFGAAYFPLYYEFATLQQYALVSESPLQIAAIQPGGLGPSIDYWTLDASRVMVVRVEWQSAGDLRLETQGRRPPIPPGPIARAMLGGDAWPLLESFQVAATAGASVYVFGR